MAPDEIVSVLKTNIGKTVRVTFSDGETLSVTTRDYGLWHESHAEEREEPLSLSLMRALMDSVSLKRHPDGQTISLGRRVRVLGDERRALLI